MTFKSFLGALGRGIRNVGEKVTGVVKTIGNKVGDIALAAAPALMAFNPAIGEAAAAVGGIAKGAAGIAEVAHSALGNGNLRGLPRARDHFRNIRASVDDVRRNASVVGGQLREVRSALERGR